MATLRDYRIELRLALRGAHADEEAIDGIVHMMMDAIKQAQHSGIEKGVDVMKKKQRPQGAMANWAAHRYNRKR